MIFKGAKQSPTDRRHTRLATAWLLALITFGSGVAAQETPATTAPAASPWNERFDIDVDEASARAFFAGLVAGTPYNMLVDPGVSGKVSLRLKQVTVEEVLEAVRDLYGYDYRRVRTGYLVLPATIQTRVFHLNYLDVQRDGMSKTRVSSGQITQASDSDASGDSPDESAGGRSSSGGADVTGSSVITRNSSDFWSAIETDLRIIVGAGSKDRATDNTVVINRPSGVIVVHALPGELRDVTDYLSKIEQTVTRQVVLEAKIIEVELNDAYQAGINWATVLRDGNKSYFFGQRAPQSGFDADLLAPANDQVTVAPGNPITGFINNTLGGAFTLAADFTDFNAFIELLGTQGRTRVLSSPRISTLHNQKAVIKAGSDEFFVTGVSSDTTTGTATTTSVDVELTPFFSGVALDVTPQISDSGSVLMHIHPTVSEVTDQQKIISVRGTTDSLPLALSQIRESDSIVKAQSGQIIVIGGLMRETRRRQQYKLPVLGDVPVIGRLFRSERDLTTTSELVILLRPLVVSDQDWSKIVADSEQRVEEMTRKGELKAK